MLNLKLRMDFIDRSQNKRFSWLEKSINNDESELKG